MSDNHDNEDALARLHGEGSCLTRHKARMNSDHKCSHIDQARLKAETTAKYVYTRYDSICGAGTFKSAARKTKKKNIFPTFDYAQWDAKEKAFMKKKPKKGDWDPGVGENFKHFVKPYWHNAHHVVPNRVLATAIADGAAADARLDYLIRSGLLQAKYNLNDRINMIVLPMEREVAIALSLPRHLVGDEVGPNEKKEFRSHTDYSNTIGTKVNAVVAEFARILRQGEEHDKKPSELAKAKLEKISRDIYTLLIAVGDAFKGKPLSALPLD